MESSGGEETIEVAVLIPDRERKVVTVRVDDLTVVQVRRKAMKILRLPMKNAMHVHVKLHYEGSEIIASCDEDIVFVARAQLMCR